MAQALAHRGPDDAGVYVDPSTGRCGLAHRRLAIIDLPSGAQPMSNENGTVWISYNGECYNYLELRRNLQAQGHQFKTASDTEVIVHLYEQYGSACVDHMRGMFAFALWDQAKQQLFLARDRMGQKPLYYGACAGRFVFASEPKAIVNQDWFERRANLATIGQYLLMGYIPGPESAFAGLLQLPPAHRLTVSAKNWRQPTPQRYWEIPPEPTYTGSFSDAAENIQAELTEATRLRLVSDVPLGGFLSGGIDSTTIVGLMSGLQTTPVITCSIGFESRLYNELPFARQAAERFNCNHSDHIASPDSFELVDKLSGIYDEPFADSSALPTYLLSQMARSKMTVALTGDGGDECFGGYDRYRALRLAEWVGKNRLLRWLAQRGIWNRLSRGEHHTRTHALARFLPGVSLPTAERYLKWLAVFDPALLTELLAGPISTVSGYPDPGRGPMARFFDNPAGDVPANGLPDHAGELSDHTADQASRAMLADGALYLPGDLNAKIDRASMAVGLELRCPFQDHKVVELAYSLPTDWRCGWRRGKRLLRAAFADLLPGNIARRPKMGFGVPVGQWLRGPLRPLFVDVVLSRRALERGMFAPAVIENLLAENDQGHSDHGGRLWSLLMLELWHRRYIDR